jgi:hypothetical protein
MLTPVSLTLGIDAGGQGREATRRLGSRKILQRFQLCQSRIHPIRQANPLISQFFIDFLTSGHLWCRVDASFVRATESCIFGRMGQTSNERLRHYLAQLPLRSQALLMREFERAIERGEDTAIATLVLGQLRELVRGTETETQMRAEELARLLFRPLEPFLVDGNLPARAGQIRRPSLMPVWQWLARDGAPEEVGQYREALAASSGEAEDAPLDMAVRRLQLATAEAIAQITAPSGGDNQRALARIGPPDVIEDLVLIGSVLRGREALEGLASRLPIYLRHFADSQVASVCAILNVPSLQTPQLLPFALSLLIQRLASPWQVIRIAIRMAASDDELRVAATSYGIAVSLALHDLSCLAAVLRTDIRRGQFADVGENLKALHDGVRGLRTELDLRHDSTWGKQLASIRADISNTLQSEIDSVPGRVRRILRQRADKDIPAGARIDSSEVEEVASLIEFVAVCRTYASELAINEVTLRTYSDLQQQVEQTTESLVQSLRGGDAKIRAYRHMQAEAAVRFCEVLFGPDYSALIKRSVENALIAERNVERKPRAG